MKLIIMVGMPGSGKSTFAAKYNNYMVVNQDKMGDRLKCLEAFRKAAREGQNIIVDRCNINRLQRSIWIREAQRFGIKDINAVYLAVNPEVCVKRISERKNHPTIKENFSLEKNQEIVYNFTKTFEIPQIEEGFNKILIIKND